MRKLLAAAAIPALAGCTYYYYPVAAAGPAQPEGQAAASADCREFTQTAAIGGQVRQVTGQACLQPDGTWKIR